MKLTQPEPQARVHSLAAWISAIEKPKTNRFLWVSILICAAVLRLSLIPNPGFEADVSFWKSWGLAPLDHGIVESMRTTNNNYPTPFAYLLLVMAKIYSLFADPHIFNDFWTNTNVLFLTIAKMPAILADFGIAALILWVGKRARHIGFPEYPQLFYQLLASLYLLNPLSLIDGALWGQVDSVGVFIFFGAIVLALSRRPFLAGFVYMVAMMTKLQNMIYGPVFFLFLWQRFGISGLAQAIGGTLLAFFGLNIEFIQTKNMWRVFDSLTSNYDYFPWLSLNAFNPWWIVAGGHGMDESDKITVLGLFNAKTLGLLLFASTYLMAVLFMLRETISRMMSLKGGESANLQISDTPGEQRDLLFRFLTSLLIVMCAFFFFQTQSHDRYAFPVTVFFLLWSALYCAFHIGLKKSAKDLIESPVLWRILAGYGIFTIIYFYNLHTALIYNYPNNGIPWMSSISSAPITIVAAIVQTALFLLFLWIVRKHMHPTTYLIPIALILLAIVGKNIPLLMKKPIPLSTFTPTSTAAGYANRTIDMPANASLGFEKSSFLSVQYSYYRHGIGTHAPARDIYHIAGQFKKFTSDIGVDTQGGPQGSVTFEVYGDGDRLYGSELVKRYEYPRHIEVDISGVQRLELVVTDGGNGNFDDHADWLNPQLWP